MFEARRRNLLLCFKSYSYKLYNQYLQKKI